MHLKRQLVSSSHGEVYLENWTSRLEGSLGLGCCDEDDGGDGDEDGVDGGEHGGIQ